MRIIFSAWAIILGLACSAAPRQAMAQTGCTVKAPPAQVLISAAEDPLRTNFTLNRQQMNIQGSSALAQQGALGSSHVGGLAHGVIDAGTQIEYVNAPSGNGACSTISKVTVAIHYQPNILISSEFTPGSCYQRAVMEHEMKHVMTDRQIVRDYMPRIKAIVEQTVRMIGVKGPVSPSELPSLNENMKVILGNYLDKVIEAMTAERELRQSQIDSPEEYARVQSLCSNWP